MDNDRDGVKRGSRRAGRPGAYRKHHLHVTPGPALSPRRNDKASGDGAPRRRAQPAPSVTRLVAERGGDDVEDTIYEKLLTAIFEHRLPPGTKLGEESLAGIFGVSRARIRNVLPRLAHEGVVRLEANRGAFVAKPTVDEARDVFEIRRILEPALVRGLAEQDDRRRMVASLRSHVTAERRARESGDTRALIRLSGEFHMQLAAHSGNALIEKSMRELATLTCLIIALYDKPSMPSCFGDEHGEIVDALASGDGARAGRLMVAHLDHVERNLDLRVVEAGPVDLQDALR